MSPASVNKPSIQRLWQLLDRGDLWPEGDAGEEIALILAAIDQRLERAQRAGLKVRDSNYLSFLRRSVHSHAVHALAKAG